MSPLRWPPKTLPLSAITAVVAPGHGRNVTSPGLAFAVPLVTAIVVVNAPMPFGQRP
jgi:hypothetical protein